MEFNDSIDNIISENNGKLRYKTKKVRLFRNAPFREIENQINIVLMLSNVPISIILLLKKPNSKI